MADIKLRNAPLVKVGMLIRKPINKVFEAFIYPEITTNFWFTKSSGKLEEGKKVTWTWEMYNASAQVVVDTIVPNKRISFTWGDEQSSTKVDIAFTTYGKDFTYISITNSGFKGDGDSIVEQALDSVGGFTTVLNGAKAWLEHKIKLNLIRDKFPKGLK